MQWFHPQPGWVFSTQLISKRQPASLCPAPHANRVEVENLQRPSSQVTLGHAKLTVKVKHYRPCRITQTSGQNTICSGYCDGQRPPVALLLTRCQERDLQTQVSANVCVEDTCLGSSCFRGVSSYWLSNLPNSGNADVGGLLQIAVH